MEDNTRISLSSTDDQWLQVDLYQLQILVPENDSLTLQQWQHCEQPGQLHCGTLLFLEQHYPVFALDKYFRLQPTVDDARCSGALLLQDGSDLFAIACRGLTKFEGELPARFMVPSCMHGRRQPFNEFVLLQNRATPLTDAAHLAELLRQLGADLASWSTTARQGVG